jgi:hypothetical protein
LKASFQFIEELGASYHIHASLAGTGVVVSHAGENSFEHTDALCVAIEANAIQLFSTETGKRLATERTVEHVSKVAA